MLIYFFERLSSILVIRERLYPLLNSRFLKKFSNDRKVVEKTNFSKFCGFGDFAQSYKKVIEIGNVWYTHKPTKKQVKKKQKYPAGQRASCYILRLCV